MNSPESIAGLQASYFAEQVSKLSKGSLEIKIYPDSQLGGLQEQAEQVSSGFVAFHHNTAGGIGSLYEDFGVLDTPFLYRDVAHLLRVTDLNSPVMKKLSSALEEKKNLRVLYTFYFGSRVLTLDRPVKKPEDLKSLKVRALPFPIYIAAIEGLGAQPVPIDWSLTPIALKTKVVQGQENPFNVILTNELYKYQSYLILTNHIRGAEIVVMNQKIWASLNNEQRLIIQKAAEAASAYATGLTLKQEQSDLEALQKKGMHLIGPQQGLDIRAFEAKTKALVKERFAKNWAEFYKMIEAL